MPQLDALRGLAILAVFAQHAGDRIPAGAAAAIDRALPSAAPWIMTVCHHAWWGVDLFFVVSGFSLALGYLRRPIAPGAFLSRRAVRILPAFWVALLVTIGFQSEVIGADGFAASALAHLAMLHGYVSPGGIVLIGAAWSLTTEAHFYLLLPLLAGALFRGPAWRRASFGGALCVTTWIVRAALHARFVDGGSGHWLEASQRHWIVSRLDQFVLGALAAGAFVALERSPSARRLRALAPLGVALSFAALVASFRLEGALYRSPGGSWPYALMSLSTTALVLTTCAARDGAARIVAPRPLAAIGLVSYGVFLYHQLALDLAARVLGTWGPTGGGGVVATIALALVASLAAGAASWHLVELPALSWLGSARSAVGAPGGGDRVALTPPPHHDEQAILSSDALPQ